MSRSEIIAEWCDMSAEQIDTTIKALEAALKLDPEDIERLVADGKAIIAKRQQSAPPKRGRPRRKEVVQKD